MSVFLFMSCTNNSGYKTLKKTDKNGFQYEMVTNDPMNARIYTLENGMKVYLSQNADLPRIMTLIVSRVGSKNDPNETTGLAHYFEHIMFKGTDEIGTTNWEEEEKVIEQISEMYEKHKATDNLEEKAQIYTVIDSLSQEASKFAVANEYDKTVNMLGASRTNAFTSYEVTAYMNEIPKNELDRWLMLESERFHDPVLRLFHTELETVYEEFNMGQDNDARQASFKIYESLFQKHPYGIPVIGRGSDLKNPSMVNIMNFKNQYYVSNNMAICLMGDFDFEETIQMINNRWKNHEPNPNIPAFSFEPEDPITEPIVNDVYGPDKEFVRMAFRSSGNQTKDAKYLSLIDMILSNSQAGLIDLNLTKNQKVQRAYSSYNAMNDYGIFSLVGYPRNDQTLEEVKDLLLTEIENVKNGNFDDWLIDAVVNDFKLSELKRIDGNWGVFTFLNAFISNIPWEDQVKEIDELAEINKDELVAFANEFFKDNYAVVYKRTGENKDKMMVEKPPITPFDVNRNAESEYLKNFKKEEPENIAPEFVNFDEKLKRENLSDGIEYFYANNPSNDLAYIYYNVEMGKNHLKKLPLAFSYLNYIGTEKYSLEDLSKEFYKIGISYKASSSGERSFVSISGLDENLDKGLELIEHLLANGKADQDAYDKVVQKILKDRADNKLNKSTILWKGMFSYAKYGEINPFNDIISEEELKSINPQELIDLVKDVFNYKHKVFYYGPREQNEAKNLIVAYHSPEKEFKAIPEKKEYEYKEYSKSKVYFCNYDMVQSHVVLLAKDKTFDASELPQIALFNEYFGGSMSSIIFQEFRESAGLAYSAYAGYRNPSKEDDPNYIYGFIATQPDKIEIALDKFNTLLNEIPKSENAFNNAKESIIKTINTQRIIKDKLFWTYMKNKDLGIATDYRKDVYEYVDNASFENIETFFNQNIKGKTYTYIVLGKKEDVDFNVLKKVGNVEELTLEQVFNY
jgi:zinc protease